MKSSAIAFIADNSVPCLLQTMIDSVSFSRCMDIRIFSLFLRLNSEQDKIFLQSHTYLLNDRKTHKEMLCYFYVYGVERSVHYTNIDTSLCILITSDREICAVQRKEMNEKNKYKHFASVNSEI